MYSVSCNNKCLFFRWLKINHESHEFILEPGTVTCLCIILNVFNPLYFFSGTLSCFVFLIQKFMFANQWKVLGLSEHSYGGYFCLMFTISEIKVFVLLNSIIFAIKSFSKFFGCFFIPVLPFFFQMLLLCRRDPRVHQRMNANDFLLPYDLFSWNK